MKDMNKEDQASHLHEELIGELKQKSKRPIFEYAGKRKKGQSRLNYTWRRFVELAKRFFGFRFFRDIINSELKKIYRQLLRQYYKETCKKHEQFRKKFPTFQHFIQYVNANENRRTQLANSLTKLVKKIIITDRMESPEGNSTEYILAMRDFLPRLLKQTYASDRYKVFFWACGIGASLIFIGVGAIQVVHVGDAAAQIVSDFLPFALFSIVISFALAGIFFFAVKAIAKHHVNKNAAKQIAHSLNENNAASAAIQYFEKNAGVFAELNEKLMEDPTLKQSVHNEIAASINAPQNEDEDTRSIDSGFEDENPEQAIDFDQYLSEERVMDVFEFTEKKTVSKSTLHAKYIEENVHADALDHSNMNVEEISETPH